jgi:hypothetical protein
MDSDISEGPASPLVCERRERVPPVPVAHSIPPWAIGGTHLLTGINIAGRGLKLVGRNAPELSRMIGELLTVVL